MKTLNQLIKELKEFKQNGVYESDIADIQNAVIDYQNDNQLFWFEDILYKPVYYESIIDHIRWRCDSYDLAGIQRTLEGLSYNCDYYRDDGGDYRDIEPGDLEERLDDLIRTAQYFKKNQKK